MNLLEEKLQLLSEEMSHTVYHITDIQSLYSMLTGEGFKLGNVEDSALEKHPVNTEKYKYYMSTARTMNSEYTRGYIADGTGVVIEFDGKKLSERYKGKAVDWYALKKEKFGKYYDEAEDRLYSKEKVIKDIGKYIRAVHMLSYFKNSEQGRYYRMVRSMDRSFPIYLYNKKKELMFRQINKASKV